VARVLAHEGAMSESIKKIKPFFSLLIVSSNLGNKKVLLDATQDLQFNIYTADTIGQAWEILMGRSPDVIFCDESLPDGNYQEFLSAVHYGHKAARFAVLLESENREDCLRALDLGATDIFAGSYEPSGIEQVLTQAELDTRQKTELGGVISA